jgi:hypothetical protein
MTQPKMDKLERRFMDKSDLLHTVELNGGRIEVFKHSIVFYDTEKEAMWECTYPEIYKLTDRHCNEGL